MKKIIAPIVAFLTVMSAYAYRYDYTFQDAPVSQALVRIAGDNPDVNISFIYNDLDNYRTSARVHTDNAYDAIRCVIGLNPISVLCKDGNIYVEALQHGRFSYSGTIIGNDRVPVAAATVMLLAPGDSTVITYGITDDAGHFSIPCDYRRVIGKMSCIGYKTKYCVFNSFNQGYITMDELPINLANVTVESANANLYSDKSVYLPTAKQKKSSQTAQDLINRMAIPQLRIDEDIKTASGQTVDIFIDFVPATENELNGILVNDVKRVEYYNFPSDSRFQGKAHVINFIMQKYEYGGYVKGRYYDNFIISRQLIGFAKFQYKKMTFDWAGGTYWMKNETDYENIYETYRLPQADGSIKEYDRSSVVNDAEKRNNAYWTSVKALYNSDNITMSNMLTFTFDNTPEHVTNGKVSYSSQDFKASDYITHSSTHINSLIYNGYWHFTLPGDNSITFNPQYAYTHTNMWSLYDEIDVASIANGAVDDSHQAGGDIAFTHSFGQAGTLKAACQGKFLQNRTRYSGSSSVADKARTSRLGPGVSYSYSNEKVSGSLYLGLYWDRSEYGTVKENSTAPRVNLALQYAFNKKNSLSLDFSYTKSTPSSSYRSAAVVRSNPLMSYTGNPLLVPYNSIQVESNYVLVPNNRFSVSAFGFVWIVDNRYVFDYEANESEILRTIKQPMGSYAQWQYGVQGKLWLINRSLQIAASCYMDQAHNGTPYNLSNSKLTGSVSAYYYLDNVYFGASYISPSGYPNGCMVGTWMAPRDTYTFQVGWSNNNWNLRFYTRNFFRYNTYQTVGNMKSKYYDYIRYLYSGSYAGLFQIAATYTFGFGKKVKQSNEAYQASGASTGILK